MHTRARDANQLIIKEAFPHLGRVLRHLIPSGNTPASYQRAQQVFQTFQSAIKRYQDAYLAYQLVKTDRAREVVGVPAVLDQHGNYRVLEKTGWEGYFVGCRNQDGTAMSPQEIVKAIAAHGLRLSKSISNMGYSNYDAHGQMPTMNTLLQVIEGRSFEDIEALREINDLYGAMLGHLRTELYRNRQDMHNQQEIEHLVAIYLETGALPPMVSGPFEQDIQRHLRFREVTQASLIGLPPIRYHLDGDTIITTCVLPRPAERAPDGSTFERYLMVLAPEEFQGYQFAVRIGQIGNPVMRAILNLLR